MQNDLNIVYHSSTIIGPKKYTIVSYTQNEQVQFELYPPIGGFFWPIFSFDIYDRAQLVWEAPFYGIEKARFVVEISRVERRENGQFP